MLAALVSILAHEDGLDVLQRVLDTYRDSRSFRMRIVHEHSSGLFPGTFEQTLAARGRRFELRVSQPPSEGASPPDYYCNGQAVFLLRGGELFEEPLEVPEDRSPGWEVTGGLILSAIVQSNAARALAKTRESKPAWEWRLPEPDEWKGMGVQRVSVLQDDGEGTKRTVVTLYLDAGMRRLVGFSWSPDGRQKRGSARYLDQQFDVALPDTVGDPPWVRVHR
jgi:hypothetical protein